MRARCPHCSSVFSTDRGGVQFCPSCGKQINVPAPPGTPAAAPPASPPPAGTAPETPGDASAAGDLPPPPPPAPSAAGPQPWPAQPPLPPPPGMGPGPAIPTAWERRGELGFVRAYFQTWKDVLFSPGPFWRGVNPAPTWGDALFFAWITNTLAVLIQIPFALLQLGMQRGALESSPMFDSSMRELLQVFTSPAALIGFSVGSLLLYPLLFVIGTALTHLFCLIFGAGKSGFPGTARAVAYALAPALLFGIPCLNFAALAYWFVLLVWGLSRIHRVDWWRPLLALLLPWLVLCCCLGVGFAFAVGQMK